jgi:outer membrane immunogenic protein
MRRISLAVLAITAMALNAGIQSASAAPATYNWSGWYMGLNAGGGWGNSNTPTSTVFSGTGFLFASEVSTINSAGAQSLNTKGFTGGVQAGYNWQSGNLVAGIEVDFNYFGQKGSSTTTFGILTFAASPFTIDSSVRTDWLFTVRPRLGMTTSNWLWYGTGGLAATKLKADWSFANSISGIARADSGEFYA